MSNRLVLTLSLLAFSFCFSSTANADSDRAQRALNYFNNFYNSLGNLPDDCRDGTVDQYSNTLNYYLLFNEAAIGMVEPLSPEFETYLSNIIADPDGGCWAAGASGRGGSFPDTLIPKPDLPNPTEIDRAAEAEKSENQRQRREEEERLRRQQEAEREAEAARQEQFRHNQQHGPVVEFRPERSFPYQFNDASVSCYIGPDTFESNGYCPVLVWEGRSYWALSYHDNRFAFAIIVLGDGGEHLYTIEAPGGRYLWDVWVDHSARTVGFVGQDGRYAIISWDQL